ncbi:MAG: HAD-IA family hydrolase [Alphaproteobacteria bacterium]
MTGSRRFHAVLWDFGGVFTTSPFEAFNRLEAARGWPADIVRRINSANPDTNAWARYERNEVDIDTFGALFAAEARALGVEIDPLAVLGCLGGDIRPRMVQALKSINRDYKTACITNNVKRPGFRPPAYIAAVAEIMALFNHVIESSKAGMRKPDPRIYQIACDALGVSPAQAIYLDDLGINLKPAHALGMHTIKVTSEAQALKDLTEALGHGV